MQNESMARPMPIVWFERCYLSALALRLVISIAHWDTVNAGSVQIALIVALLLWFGVVHRRSNVARWLVLLMFVVTAAGTLLRLGDGGLGAIWVVLALVALALQAFAAFQLLVAEAQPWFAKAQPEDPASGGE
jgi:hypothetical protein